MHLRFQQLQLGTQAGLLCLLLCLFFTIPIFKKFDADCYTAYIKSGKYGVLKYAWIIKTFARTIGYCIYKPNIECRLLRKQEPVIKRKLRTSALARNMATGNTKSCKP